MKAPLGYPLLWDLILWSKRQGANWFDLGGVTFGDKATDPLKGISDFKRYFSRTVEDLSEEWVMEVRPKRARVAGAVGQSVRGVTNLIGRLTREETGRP